MSGGKNNTNSQPAYSALTNGELLTLTRERESLSETAQQALADEITRRGLGKEHVVAFHKAAERERARKTRLWRARRMRVTSFLSAVVFVILSTVAAIALSVFAANAISAGTVRNLLGISSRAADYLGDGVVIVVWAIYFAAMVLYSRSRRADRWIRRWLPGKAPKKGNAEEALRAHQRYCPARNLGYALGSLVISVFMLFVSLKDIEGWHFLHSGYQPPPWSAGWSTFETVSMIYLVVVLILLLRTAPCFREKLWWGLWAAALVAGLPEEWVNSFSTRAIALSKDFFLVLWVIATLVALSWVKSAWNGGTQRNPTPQI